jgi:hypothetical protein
MTDKATRLEQHEMQMDHMHKVALGLVEAQPVQVAAFREFGNRVLGMPRARTEVTGADGAPLTPEADPVEIARRVAFLLAAGAAHTEK